MQVLCSSPICAPPLLFLEDTRKCSSTAVGKGSVSPSIQHCRGQRVSVPKHPALPWAKGQCPQASSTAVGKGSVSPSIQHCRGQRVSVPKHPALPWAKGQCPQASSTAVGKGSVSPSIQHYRGQRVKVFPSSPALPLAKGQSFPKHPALLTPYPLGKGSGRQCDVEFRCKNNRVRIGKPGI